MAATPSEPESKVPKITALRTALQYNDLRLPRCDAFKSALTHLRTFYITSTGMHGYEVREWRSANHQTLLTEMSRAFLDRDGNGELYWPTDATSPNYNSLQYSNQKSFIQEHVKELLYRLNIQQYRNAKYRPKATKNTHVPAATVRAATVKELRKSGARGRPTAPNHEVPQMCKDAVNASVKIRYYLVFRQGSIPTHQAWRPKGNLRNKKLQDLKVEIPIIKDYEEFVLRLRAGSFCTEQVIRARAEFGFDYAKENLDITIRCLACRQMRTQPTKVLQIIIEIESKGSDDEEGDMKGFELVKVRW